jgi:hypothetical protein
MPFLPIGRGVVAGRRARRFRAGTPVQRELSDLPCRQNNLTDSRLLCIVCGADMWGRMSAEGLGLSRPERRPHAQTRYDGAATILWSSGGRRSRRIQRPAYTRYCLLSPPRIISTTLVPCGKCLGSTRCFSAGILGAAACVDWLPSRESAGAGSGALAVKRS